MTELDNIRKQVINHILKVEGGYVNDPSDSGGETNYGITIKVARKYGYKQNMQDLSRQTAFNIYKGLYWDRLRLDDMWQICGCNGEASKLVRELADTGVNMGTIRAGKFMQKSLNALNDKGSIYFDLKVDGKVGDQTLKALTTYAKKRKNGMPVLTAMLNCLQGAHYIKIATNRPKDRRFVNGWFMNRIL